MSKTLYILRHAETDYNRKGIIQGSGIDAPINSKGRKQANLFYEAYRKIPFQVVMASQLQRTQQTIHSFISENRPLEIFDQLNEISWGIYEGKYPNREMKIHYAQINEQWAAGKTSERINGGESPDEVSQRLQGFLEKLEQREEERFLICTHGRTIRILMCMLSGQALSEMANFGHKNTGVYQVNFQLSKSEIVVHNDYRHILTNSSKG